MQNTPLKSFALTLANQMIAERFQRDYGITTWAEYLDHLDRRTTAHLPDHMAERVIRTAGQQRRDAKLTIEDGLVIIAVPMNNPRTGETVWAELFLSTWLNVIECGADGSWLYNLKGAAQEKGQVRTHVPMSGGEKMTLTTIARVIGNAKKGQQARMVDRNPMNLRSANVAVVGHPKTCDDVATKAKTDTRAKAREKLALRASLAKRGSDDAA